MARTSLTVDYFFSVVGRDLDAEGIRDTEVADYIKRSENVILAFTSSNGDPASGVWVDAICSAIQFDMINRVYNNPAGKSAESMGPENQSFAAPGGLFLLPGEKEQLTKLIGRGTFGGLGTIKTYRGDYYNW
jgi:hypothetical protein